MSARIAIAAVLLASLAGHHGWADARSLLAGAYPPADELSGRAIVIEVDWHERRPQRLVAVQTPDGHRVQVEVDAGNQAAWRAARSLRTGQSVTMAGRWLGGAPTTAGASSTGAHSSPRFQAALIQPAEVDEALPVTAVAGLAGAATTAPAGPRLSSNARISSSMAALFVPLQAQDASGAYCPGTSAPPMTVDQLEAAIFEEVSPDTVTVGSTFNRCSQGQLLLTRDNSRVVDPVVLPCNGTVPRTNAYWNVSSCPYAHFMAWADEADRILAQERKIDLAAHPFRVYLTPAGSCDFIGLAFLGCDYKLGCRAWIGGSSWHVQQALVHEMGHNLFMHHAGSYQDSGTFDEYADVSCAMGYCCDNRCFNTPHMWQQGWLAAAEYDHTNLGKGQTVTLTLAAQGASSDGRHRAVRVVPSWAPAPTQGSPAVDPLFIGYRTGLGIDSSLFDSLKNHVLLYTSPVKTARDPQYTTLRAALTGKMAWNYTAAGLVIRTQALSSDTAQISICRQAPGGRETAGSCANRLDYNCDGRVGSADPQCLPFMNLKPLLPTVPRRKVRRPGRSLERKPKAGR